MGAGNSTLGEKILFPTPERTYDASLPGLVWINPNTTDNSGESAGAALEGGESEKGSALSFPALWIKASEESREVLLYFHGNSCDLGDVYNELCVLSSFVGCNVLAIEYPSYGLAAPCGSDISIPQCIDTWARAAFEFLIQSGAAPENVILFGRSIGTGPAARLAAELEIDGQKAGGLVLHAPFVSIHEVVAEYSFLGVHLIPNYWRTDEALAALHSTPLLLIHGEADEVIPVRHGQKLFSAFQGRKMSAFSEDASHNEYFIIDDVGEPLKKFLLEMSNSRHAPLLSLAILQSHPRVAQSQGEAREDQEKNANLSAGDGFAVPVKKAEEEGQSMPAEPESPRPSDAAPSRHSASFQRLLRSGLLSGEFLREVVSAALDLTDSEREEDETKVASGAAAESHDSDKAPSAA